MGKCNCDKYRKQDHFKEKECKENKKNKKKENKKKEKRESAETLNKVLNELTLLNSNLEKKGTAISSMQQNVPTTNSSSTLANLDAAKMLDLLTVAGSIFKGTETGQTMYPRNQVPQPVDKVLAILTVARSIFKGTETGQAMYPRNQVPQPNPLSFLNNLDVDKVLETLTVVRSLYKTDGESEDKNENKE